MEKWEFLRRFEEKVKTAQKKSEDANNKREAEMRILKEKSISELQVQFLEAIPEELLSDKKIYITSQWMEVKYDKFYYFYNVCFKFYDQIMRFAKELSEEFESILGKKVGYEIVSKNDCSCIRFYILY